VGTSKQARTQFHATMRKSTMGLPSLEKQWCRSLMYAFSCCVLCPWVRHTPRQYSHTLPQLPAAGYLGDLRSRTEQHG
jgi:hypothetical protein